MKRDVYIKEVGPRDGLQNELRILSTKQKIQLVNELSETGLTYIEVSSFVSSRKIPALADAEYVFQGINRNEHVMYGALVPNERGLTRALTANVDEVCLFLSATETHSQRNRNQTIQQSLDEAQRVLEIVKSKNKKVRAYISMVWGCPYEGEVEPEQSRTIASQLLKWGCDELALGDTIGVASPKQIQHTLQAYDGYIPFEKVALHLHDTNGFALANIYVALESGIRTFDSSISGLGGCPYAKGATGNVATNDVVAFVHALGLSTGINEDALQQISKRMELWFGKSRSHIYERNKGGEAP